MTDVLKDFEEGMLRAKELSEQRDVHGVVETLTSLDRTWLLKDIEGSFLLVSSWTLLFRHQEAESLLLEIREKVEATGNANLNRRWKNLYAVQMLALGNLEYAENLFAACVESAERDQHQRLIAHANGSLGIVAGMRGDVDKALSYYNRGISASKQFGAALEIARAHHNIGLTLREWGRGADAFPHFMHAADYYAEKGLAEERAFTAAERAILLVEFGDGYMAEQLARSAVERCKSFSNLPVEATANRALGIVLREAGDMERARVHLEKAIDFAQQTSFPIILADASEEMALLDAAEGKASADFHRANALQAFRSMGLVRHCDRFARRFTRVKLGQGAFT